MKQKVTWLVLSIKTIVISILTFLKTPEEITETLTRASAENSLLAAVMHALYLVMTVAGFAVKRIRNTVFGILLLILSGSAAVVAVRYGIVPNILIFAIFFILTARAMIKKELDFEVSGQSLAARIAGFAAIFFGFYYLHWVSEPLLVNALVYSPLGIANCPTMAAFAGFLCFLRRPGSPFLEAFVGVITLYFGFFGIMRLGAYVDIVLIAAGASLLARLVYERGRIQAYPQGQYSEMVKPV
jgi:hypothetical protein